MIQVHLVVGACLFVPVILHRMVLIAVIGHVPFFQIERFSMPIHRAIILKLFPCRDALRLRWLNDIGSLKTTGLIPLF